MCVGIVVNWPLGRVEVVNSVVNSVNVSILDAVLGLGVAVITTSITLLVGAVVKAEEAAFATTEVVMVVLRPVEINTDIDGKLSVTELGIVLLKGLDDILHQIEEPLQWIARNLWACHWGGRDGGAICRHSLRDCRKSRFEI